MAFMFFSVCVHEWLPELVHADSKFNLLHSGRNACGASFFCCRVCRAPVNPCLAASPCSTVTSVQSVRQLLTTVGRTWSKITCITNERLRELLFIIPYQRLKLYTVEVMSRHSALFPFTSHFLKDTKAKTVFQHLDMKATNEGSYIWHVMKSEILK